MLKKLLLFVSVFINCLKFVLYLIFSLYVNARLVDDQVMYQFCKNYIYWRHTWLYLRIIYYRSIIKVNRILASFNYFRINSYNQYTFKLSYYPFFPVLKGEVPATIIDEDGRHCVRFVA